MAAELAAAVDAVGRNEDAIGWAARTSGSGRSLAGHHRPISLCNDKIVVTSTRFAWDPVKAEANLRKHRISFEVASRAFADPYAISAQDRIEDGEHRWATIGLVESIPVVLVAYTLHDDGGGTEIIRIISARRADRQERRHYERERSRRV